MAYCSSCSSSNTYGGGLGGFKNKWGRSTCKLNALYCRGQKLVNGKYVDIPKRMPPGVMNLTTRMVDPVFKVNRPDLLNTPKSDLVPSGDVSKSRENEKLLREAANKKSKAGVVVASLVGLSLLLK